MRSVLSIRCSRPACSWRCAPPSSWPTRWRRSRGPTRLLHSASSKRRFAPTRRNRPRCSTHGSIWWRRSTTDAWRRSSAPDATGWRSAPTRSRTWPRTTSSVTLRSRLRGWARFGATAEDCCASWGATACGESSRRRWRSGRAQSASIELDVDVSLAVIEIAVIASCPRQACEGSQDGDPFTRLLWQLHDEMPRVTQASLVQVYLASHDRGASLSGQPRYQSTTGTMAQLSQGVLWGKNPCDGIARDPTAHELRAEGVEPRGSLRIPNVILGRLLLCPLLSRHRMEDGSSCVENRRVSRRHVGVRSAPLLVRSPGAHPTLEEVEFTDLPAVLELDHETDLERPVRVLLLTR